MQGILSVLGIAGFEWVPARLAHFYQTKYCFYWTNGWSKTGKTGTQLYAEPSPVQYSLTDVTYNININNNNENFYLIIHKIQNMIFKQIEIYVKHN